MRKHPDRPFSALPRGRQHPGQLPVGQWSCTAGRCPGGGGPMDGTRSPPGARGTRAVAIRRDRRRSPPPGGPRAPGRCGSCPPRPGEGHMFGPVECCNVLGSEVRPGGRRERRQDPIRDNHAGLMPMCPGRGPSESPTFEMWTWLLDSGRPWPQRHTRNHALASGKTPAP